jgi:hypothetical protein
LNNTFERLCAMLVNDHKLPLDRLTLDAPLESLGINFLGTVELLWNVEFRKVLYDGSHRQQRDRANCIDSCEIGGAHVLPEGRRRDRRRLRFCRDLVQSHGCADGWDRGR